MYSDFPEIDIFELVTNITDTYIGLIVYHYLQNFWETAVTRVGFMWKSNQLASNCAMLLQHCIAYF